MSPLACGDTCRIQGVAPSPIQPKPARPASRLRAPPPVGSSATSTSSPRHRPAAAVHESGQPRTAGSGRRSAGQSCWQTTGPAVHRWTPAAVHAIGPSASQHVFPEAPRAQSAPGGSQPCTRRQGRTANPTITRSHDAIGADCQCRASVRAVFLLVIALSTTDVNPVVNWWYSASLSPVLPLRWRCSVWRKDR
jgi:hypothetical protein